MRRVVMLLSFVSLGVLVLAGCALLRTQTPSALAGPSGESPPGGSKSPEVAPAPQPGGSPDIAAVLPTASAPGTTVNPEPEDQRPSFSARPLRATSSTSVVSGILAFDSVEGGCPYLRSADGTRYQVIFPDGWQIEGSTGRLLGVGGGAADPGSVITVRGSIVVDIASVCQVGPMFRATEVISIGE